MSRSQDDRRRNVLEFIGPLEVVIIPHNNEPDSKVRAEQMYRQLRIETAKAEVREIRRRNSSQKTISS